MPPNNANNKKSSSNSTRKNNNVVNKVIKNVKKMDMTTMLLLVVVVIVLYLVFFDGKIPKLFNHRHQRRNEGFNNSLTQADKCVLVLFHADWCGYCKKFMPTWNKAQSTLQSSDVVLKDFEADADKEVMKENGVSSYPTLKMFKKNGEVIEYEGDRSLEDLDRFIKENKD